MQVIDLSGHLKNCGGSVFVVVPERPGSLCVAVYTLRDRCLRNIIGLTFTTSDRARAEALALRLTHATGTSAQKVRDALGAFVLANESVEAQERVLQRFEPLANMPPVLWQ